MNLPYPHTPILPPDVSLPEDFAAASVTFPPIRGRRTLTLRFAGDFTRAAMDALTFSVSADG